MTNKQGPVAVRMPEPCKYDETWMVNTDEGTRCPKCGHQEFDKHYTDTTDNGGKAIPKQCHCFNCYSVRIQKPETQR